MGRLQEETWAQTFKEGSFGQTERQAFQPKWSWAKGQHGKRTQLDLGSEDCGGVLSLVATQHLWTPFLWSGHIPHCDPSLPEVESRKHIPRHFVARGQALQSSNKINPYETWGQHKEMATERESGLPREHNDGASGSPWAEVEFCHLSPTIMHTAAVVMMFSPEQPPSVTGVVPDYRAPRDARSNNVL